MTTLDLDRAEFLKAILRIPDDDTARLIFADWLADHGEADRGEFIRVQVELSKTCRCGGSGYVFFRAEYDPKGADVPPDGYVEPCPECNPGDLRDVPCPSVREIHTALAALVRLAEREARLFNADWLPHCGGQLRQWWFGSVPPGGVIDRPFCFVVSRGFVSAVTTSAADWFAHAGDITPREPVRRVNLTTMPLLNNRRTERGDDDMWFPDDPVRRVLRANDVARRVRRARHAGRSGSWGVAMLEMLWPGITFELPA